MNAFTLSATVLAGSLIAPLLLIARGNLVDSVIALSYIGVVATVLLLLLAAIDSDSALADPALVLAFLSFGSGLVYLHFFERRL